MKAFKLASGFAVSALTLAIAGTAAAQATTEISTTGAIQVQSINNLESEARYNNFPGYFKADEDWYNLSITTTVTHGPFSGKVRVGIFEDEGDGNGTTNGNGADSNAQVKVFDLRVDEGPISFGQIGRVTHTAALYEDLTDENELLGKDESTRLGVTAALRYTLDLGDTEVRVQSEGAPQGNAPTFGLAASAKHDLGVAEVLADVQFRQVTNVVGADTDGNPIFDGMEDDALTTFGVGVTATPIDQVSLSAVFRNDSRKDGGNGDSVYAVKAELSVSDDISVFGLVTDREVGSDNDSTLVRVGATAGFAPITVEGAYETLAAEFGDGLVWGKVSYAENAIGAYAEVFYGLPDGAGLQFEVGADYTTESGVVFGGKYENGDYSDEDSEASVATLFAKYSF
ncbi:MAG: hypothetical protein JXQ97_12740 [Natronospirillum sp.]